MTTAHSDTSWQQVSALLPEELQDAWQHVLELRHTSREPLNVCVAGSFSTGKSSLINALIGQELLPSGHAETTALSTVLTYGETFALGELGPDGATWGLEREAFQQLVAQHSEDAAVERMGLVRVPAPWLKGYQLLDLPGLGGTDELRRSAARAKIVAADVILYLISPRGLTADDLEALNLVRQRGKHLILVVSKWDENEAAVARGESLVKLEAWQEQLRKQTQLTAALLPVSNKGHNLDLLKAQLAALNTQAHGIRQRRAAAEALPLIERACLMYEEHIRAFEISSEERRHTLRQEIVAQREQLLGAKEALFAEMEREYEAFDTRLAGMLSAARSQLVEALRPLGASLAEARDPQRWESVLEQLNAVAAEHASLFVDRVTQAHSELELGEAQQALWSRIQLTPPRPPTLDRDVLFDQSELAHATAQLQKLHERIAQTPVTDPHEQELVRKQCEEIAAHLGKLQTQRNRVLVEPLPMVMEERKPSAAEQMGVSLGGVLDVALLFTPLAAFKALPIGAKLIPQIAKTARTLLGGADYAARAGAVPLPALHVISKLNLSTLGGTLGRMFDSGSPERVYEDPEAKELQAKKIQALDTDLTALRRELEQLQERSREASQNKHIQRLTQQELESTEARIRELQQLREEQQRRSEALLEESWRARLALSGQQATERIQLSFEQRANGILGAALRAMRQHQRRLVNEQLHAQEQHLQTTLAALELLPAERDAQIQTRRERLERLRGFASSMPS